MCNTCTTNSPNRQCASGQICRNNQCQQGTRRCNFSLGQNIFSNCLCLTRLIKYNKEYVYHTQHHVLIITVHKVNIVPQVDCVNHYHAPLMDSVPMEPIVLVVDVKVNIFLFFSGKAIKAFDSL